MTKTSWDRAGLVVAIGMGVISLFLQALWQRELSLLTGNTLYGVSLVVGGWMAGYGGGNFLALWLLPRLRKPLSFLLWTQVGVCALALLFVPWFGIMQYFPKPWVYVGAFFSVFFPSLSWGMGMPLLGGTFGISAISRLYGWNTLASAGAVLVMDFLFLPVIGARGSLFAALAVGMGIFLGLLVFVSQQEGIRQTRNAHYHFHYQGGGIILGLFALSGFTSLGYQLVYNRQLLYFTGNTIFCYGIITAVFIGGMAIGALGYARWREKIVGNLFFWIGVLEGGIALWHAAFPLFSLGINTLLLPLKGNEVWSLFLVRVLATLFLIGIPVMFFGMLYPMFLEAFHEKNRGEDGQDTALASGMNTIGSVAGIIVVAFFLVDHMGISGTLRFLAWISAFVGSVAFLLAREVRLGWLLVGVACALVFLPIEDKIGRMAAQEFQGSELLYYKEGVHGTVSVTRHPEGILHLKINGVGEVPTDYHSLRVFRFLAYAPFVFVPHASNVLVIALGAGITFGGVMEVPGVVATNVEICPDVVGGALFFTNYNHDVVRRYRSHIVFDDGVAYLLRTRGRYDLLIADATHPASGDSWVLYTREFYQRGKERLVSGGAMAQWLPLHNLSVKDMQVIVKTFASVFASVHVYFCHEYLVMIGSDAPLVAHPSGWKRLLTSPGVTQDLASVHLTLQGMEDMLVWESTNPPLWEKHTPLSTMDLSPLQFSEIRSWGKETRTEILSFLLEKGRFRQKTYSLLTLHKHFLAKDYLGALRYAYSLPSSFRDEAWEYQQKRIERFFLLSLRTPEGMQKVVSSEYPETWSILEKLEPQDPLFVGVGKALILAAKEKYREAEEELTKLTKTYHEPWLVPMLEQIRKEAHTEKTEHPKK
ncbi:MAG: hypothetical protein N2314_04190 [Brevinematales bacterium]|nr:hypothetical protein [Brevinematales bacterium]